MHGWHPGRGRHCRKVTEKSIRQFHENLCLLFPNATRRGGGHAAVKGCFLIAQLELAFVEPKFYLYKMAPRSPPKMHGTAWIKTKNAINSPSRRREGEADKIFSVIHAVPPIWTGLMHVSLHFERWSSCGVKPALHVAPLQSGFVWEEPPSEAWISPHSSAHIQSWCNKGMMKYYHLNVL